MNFSRKQCLIIIGVAFAIFASCLLFFIVITNFSIISNFMSGMFEAFSSVIFGFAFAYVLTPLMNFSDRKWFTKLWMKIFPSKPGRARRFSRMSGAIFAILCIIALIAGLLIVVLPEIIRTLQLLTLNMNSYLSLLQSAASELLADYPQLNEQVNEFIRGLSLDLVQLIKDFILPHVNDIASAVSGGIIKTLGTLLNIVIGLIICVYMLYGKDLFAAQGKKVLYALFKPELANGAIRNLRSIHKTFGGFIVGKLLDCLVVGVLFAVTMTIFHMPYVALISVLMAVANIIPYFGPFVGTIPSALLILLVDPVTALYFLIMSLVLMQIDGNIIEPRILADNTGLSSFWVIFSLILGEYVAGPLGMIVGVPLFAVAYSIIKAKVGQRLALKGLPEDTTRYGNADYVAVGADDALAIIERAGSDRAAKSSVSKNGVPLKDFLENARNKALKRKSKK